MVADNHGVVDGGNAGVLEPGLPPRKAKEGVDGINGVLGNDGGIVEMEVNELDRECEREETGGAQSCLYNKPSMYSACISSTSVASWTTRDESRNIVSGSEGRVDDA